jgi:transposase
MTLLPPGVKVHLAFGYTDMRKGIDGLAMLVQGVLRQDPFSGHLFVFRGRKANLLKIVFWDGTGLCLSGRPSRRCWPRQNSMASSRSPISRTCWNACPMAIRSRRRSRREPCLFQRVASPMAAASAHASVALFYSEPASPACCTILPQRSISVATNRCNSPVDGMAAWH